MQSEEERASESILPVAVTVQVTAKCNLTCSHCAVVDAVDRGATWTPQMVRKLFSGLRERTPILDITGGEPLVEWDIVSLFGREAAVRQMLWGITTNGILLNRRHVDELLDMNVYAVKVSIDGLRTHHELVRGKGTFDAALEAVELLVSSGIPVGIQTALSRTNKDDLPQLVSLLDGRGVSTLILFPLMPLGRQARMPDTVLRGRELKEVVLEVANMATNHMTIQMELPQCGSLLQNHLEEESARCAAGWMLHFVADGVAWPCPVFPLSLGSLMKDSIDDLVRNPIQANLRERIGIRGRCAMCSSFNTCGGGCRAMAYVLGGDLRAEDPFCWMNDD